VITGVVREWHGHQGWGVIDSDETPGGCFAYYADIQMPGFRALSAGQSVWFEARPGGQDGCAYRATAIALIPEIKPVEPPPPSDALHQPPRHRTR
jgi:CspA family cold shock protein